MALWPRLQVALVTMAALLVATPSRAQAPAHHFLERARLQIEELRLDLALESLDSALRSGENGPAETAEILHLLGEVTASLGLSDAAVGHFERWLALRPSAALEEGVSPKIERPFIQARAALAARAPLRVHYEVVADRDPIVLLLIVDSDPMAMVAGARARLSGRAQPPLQLEQRGTGRIQIALPPGSLEVVLAAIDQYGNRVAEIGVERSIVIAAPKPARRPLYGRWFVWGGAALGVALVGAGLSVGAAVAQNDLQRVIGDSANHDFREARGLENSARGEWLAAGIGFGVAGALAIAATTLGIHDLGARRARAAQARVALAPPLSLALTF